MKHGEGSYFSDCENVYHLQSQGMGLWLLGAFWSLPFQLIISPVRWAIEEVADRVAVNMESQAHMDDKKWRMSGYPLTMLHEMRGGHILYPPYVPRLGKEAEDTI
jgi:hypothetical protein